MIANNDYDQIEDKSFHYKKKFQLEIRLKLFPKGGEDEDDILRNKNFEFKVRNTIDEFLNELASKHELKNLGVYEFGINKGSVEIIAIALLITTAHGTADFIINFQSYRKQNEEKLAKMIESAIVKFGEFHIAAMLNLPKYQIYPGSEKKFLPISRVIYNLLLLLILVLLIYKDREYSASKAELTSHDNKVRNDLFQMKKNQQWIERALKQHLQGRCCGE